MVNEENQISQRTVRRPDLKGSGAVEIETLNLMTERGFALKLTTKYIEVVKTRKQVHTT